MPATVEAAVVPGDGAADARVGAVSDTDGVLVLLGRLRANGHRHREGLGITSARLNLDRREVLGVIERELRGKQLRGLEGVTFLVAQVLANQLLVDRVLLDFGGAEAIALTGLEDQVRPRAPARWIDQQLVARIARVEETRAKRRALQVALEPVVGTVTQTSSRLELRVGDQVAEHGFFRAGPRHVDLHLFEKNRRPRIDAQRHAPVAAVRQMLEGRLHGRLVVTEGTQRLAHFDGSAFVQAPNRVGRQVVAIAVTLQAQVDAEIGLDLLVDALDDDLDVRAGGLPGGKECKRREPTTGMVAGPFHARIASGASNSNSLVPDIRPVASKRRSRISTRPSRPMRSTVEQRVP